MPQEWSLGERDGRVSGSARDQATRCDWSTSSKEYSQQTAWQWHTRAREPRREAPRRESASSPLPARSDLKDA
jgi:hypothetical protein